MHLTSPSARSARLAAAALVLGAALAGCGGGTKSADAYWSTGKTEGEEGGPRPTNASDEFSGSSVGQQDEPLSTWVGVRHDLMLAPSPSRTERCSCLAVEVGAAEDPKFQWVAGAPQIGNDAITIALSARGVPCPGGNPDEEKRRPSISAVDQEGNDIIVEVEELKDGRPLATGAVIPRPAAGGGIYVTPRDSKLPYARPVGSAKCKVF